VIVTAIDREPAVAAVAAAEGPASASLRLVCADARRLPFAERSFDVVTASLFLHHFEHREIVQLLHGFALLARHAVVINDLRRHLVPWLFIWVASRVSLRHPMYVHDAPLSVLRGFTRGELARLARECGPAGFELLRRLPYRLVLTLRVEEAPP
jgi:2-polyprenyl-3-methyl-5-hydroxy-6-metoxy-1,4-benzoquinol methylase